MFLFILFFIYFFGVYIYAYIPQSYALGLGQVVHTCNRACVCLSMCVCKCVGDIACAPKCSCLSKFVRLYEWRTKLQQAVIPPHDFRRDGIALLLQIRFIVCDDTGACSGRSLAAKLHLNPRIPLPLSLQRPISFPSPPPRLLTFIYLPP